MKAITLKDLNRAQFAERFHTVNHTHSQKIADHAYIMALYTQHISNSLYQDNNLQLTPENSLSLMDASLNHGLSKLISGDQPSNYTGFLKSTYPELYAAQKKVIDSLYPEGKLKRDAIKGSPLNFVFEAAKLIDAYQYIKLTGTIDTEQQSVILASNTKNFNTCIEQAEKAYPTLNWDSVHQARQEILFGKSGLLSLELNRTAMDDNEDSVGLTIRDMAKTQFATRWHTVLTLKEQSLASHSFIVTLLSQDMAKLQNPDISAKEQLKLMDYALRHDSNELISGDQNGSFRAYMRRLNPGVIDEQERALDMLCPDLAKYSEAIEGTHYKHIVKAADIIDAISFITLTGADAESQFVIANKLEEYFDINLESAISNYPNMNWGSLSEIKEEYLYGPSGLLEMEMNSVSANASDIKANPIEELTDAYDVEAFSMS